MESSVGKESNGRVPLSGVVADCAKRWFKDTLREAKAGDVNMQVLVGQMYYSGYGVPKDAQKVGFVCLFYWYFDIFNELALDCGLFVCWVLILGVLCFFKKSMLLDKREKNKSMFG